MRNFEVVGDVLGEELAEMLGVDAVAVKPAANGGGGPMLRLRPKADWRKGQLAPGVMAPDEGLVPLPMKPDTNGGVFTAAIASMEFVGRLQKPFRSERLLVSATRSTVTATSRLLGRPFVGVDLQQATLQKFDLELVGTPTAFGTRLTLVQAPPGVDVTIDVDLSTPLTGADTIFASMMFLGRIVH